MYAIRLRCLNLDDINEILPNVNKTLTLLRLHDVKHVNAKLLSRGDRRRLSIAEELVTGPNFMLLDEPVTNLNAKESALIMNAFRELVNQEKTVVATMHEPSAEVFSLCDHLVLLSKGRVIYTGIIYYSFCITVSSFSPFFSSYYYRFSRESGFLFY